MAVGGALAGYNGTFQFESGHQYPVELNYSVIRLFLASFGALMVPLAFLTMHELGFQRRTCLLAATMVLCGTSESGSYCALRVYTFHILDNALLSISRYILLDSMLLFFTALTVYCMAVFRNMDRMAPFSVGWWLWLCATGSAIGCVSR